jgi:hypothetical protein
LQTQSQQSYGTSQDLNSQFAEEEDEDDVDEEEEDDEEEDDGDDTAEEDGDDNARQSSFFSLFIWFHYY